MIRFENRYYTPGKMKTIGITYKSGLVDSFVVDPESTVFVIGNNLTVVNPKKGTTKSHDLNEAAGFMMTENDATDSLEKELARIKELMENVS